MPIPLLLIAAALDVPQAQPILPPTKPKLICRQSDQQLGSHIRARRCKTAAEWALIDAELDRIPPSMRVTRGQEDGRPVEHSQ